jgi:peptidoglycan/LPS O-acetylase OafA/YrhL
VLVLIGAIAGSAAVMIAVPHDWLPMHAYALLSGCLLALLGPLQRRWWLVPAGALGLVVSLEVAPTFHQIYVYGPLMVTPAAVLLVAGAAPGNGVLELPVLRFLGRISYALYLWHASMLRLTETTYGRSAALPSIALSLVAAVASTLLVEEPLRRAWRSHHTSAAATPHDALT